jgi:hypothetical protein
LFRFSGPALAHDLKQKPAGDNDNISVRRGGILGKIKVKLTSQEDLGSSHSSLNEDR